MIFFCIQIFIFIFLQYGSCRFIINRNEPRFLQYSSKNPPNSLSGGTGPTYLRKQQAAEHTVLYFPHTMAYFEHQNPYAMYDIQEERKLLEKQFDKETEDNNYFQDVMNKEYNLVKSSYKDGIPGFKEISEPKKKVSKQYHIPTSVPDSEPDDSSEADAKIEKILNASEKLDTELNEKRMAWDDQYLKANEKSNEERVNNHGGKYRLSKQQEDIYKAEGIKDYSIPEKLKSTNPSQDDILDVEFDTNNEDQILQQQRDMQQAQNITQQSYKYSGVHSLLPNGQKIKY